MLNFIKMILSIFSKKKEVVIPAIGHDKQDTFGLGDNAKGIDISHHNRVDMDKLKHDFIFVKASEGLDFVDPAFKRRWEKLKGTKRGAYHYYKADKDALSQAVYFCETVGLLDVNDLPLVLDIEELGSISKEELKTKLRIFLNEIENTSRKTPIIYGGYFFLLDLDLELDFAKYPLWIADYDKKAPRIPNPWNEYLFWQYTETEIIDGIGKCDCNLFKSN